MHSARSLWILERNTVIRVVILCSIVVGEGHGKIAGERTGGSTTFLSFFICEISLEDRAQRSSIFAIRRYGRLSTMLVRTVPAMMMSCWC